MRSVCFIKHIILFKLRYMIIITSIIISNYKTRQKSASVLFLIIYGLQVYDDKFNTLHKRCILQH